LLFISIVLGWIAVGIYVALSSPLPSALYLVNSDGLMFVGSIFGELFLIMMIMTTGLQRGILPTAASKKSISMYGRTEMLG